ncbi:MAG TPA: N-acetylmuramoyl-L-alanine amidase [Thermoanaerobaculaceae bacterium]|nr:N-acetylmuramoyl-L-alanine amidase [Thermoanaerobaculaceae bacterium]
MRVRLAIACLLALTLPLPAAAVTVATPAGSKDVFARGDLLDVVALLKLAGADVEFAPAAGSYNAATPEHQIQFTPGGALAVVDGRLTPLPGPLRLVEGHVVAAQPTATALLAPLGWTLKGTAGAPELVRVAGGEQIEVSVVRAPTGTTIVVRGTKQRPKVTASQGSVALQFASPVALLRPVTAESELLGGELRENTLTLRVASGVEVAGTYPLDDPPRFVVRLGAAAPVAPVAVPRTGSVVVLDPGHGGEDQGAKGPGNELEKDITLAVARATAAHLQAAGIAARLTRDGDDAVSLTDRTALANKLQASVFLSIHANASMARGAHGAETYYMSADASDPQAAQAAARENASAPPDTVQLILWDLAHVANLNNSARLARDVQERLNALQGIRDRGIRQAPFVVLTGATMPAALVEVGFLSNADESARLAAHDVQDQIATALSEAIVDFIRTPAPEASPSPSAAPTP